ncbi:tRNA (guanine(10)-N(2))-dimethyltransferase [Candidatus Woesearchaeota archaeon]|nr:tRNA (guanine(10)-N(2))-dimethyltransferase [Candidatus Woesearchaeota archaeon]
MAGIIEEGRARIYFAEPAKISKSMGVFYNPAMKQNRDLTVLLLDSAGKASKPKMQIADPLAGTGIRSIRLLLELGKSKIRSISINDNSKAAAAAIRRKLKINKIRIGSGKGGGKIRISAKDANIFLLESTGFDYIDIDPFGSPARFLDAAAQRIARGGILAVTATDTAALAGSSPSACMRKYWAKPLRNMFMHETGLRILIRRVQLAGMQYEKALIPIFSYKGQYYLRAFFRCEKGRIKSAQIYKSHGFIIYCPKCLQSEAALELISKTCNSCGIRADYAGPLWLGKLADASIVAAMLGKSPEEHRQLLSAIRKESAIGRQWFYNVNSVCRKYGIRSPPPINELLKSLRNSRFIAARTHFDWAAVRTDASISEIVRTIKKGYRVGKAGSLPTSLGR